MYWAYDCRLSNIRELPVANESLYMIDNGKAIGRAILLRRKAGIPSGVCDNLLGSLS